MIVIIEDLGHQNQRKKRHALAKDGKSFTIEGKAGMVQCGPYEMVWEVDETNLP